MHIFLLDCWYFNFWSVRPGLSSVADCLNLTLCLFLWIKFIGTQLYLLIPVLCLAAFMLPVAELSLLETVWFTCKEHLLFKKGSVDPWFNFIFSRAPLCLSHTLHRFSSFVYLWFILHIFFWTIFQLIHSLCLQICLLCCFFHCHDNIKYYFL